MIENTTMNKHEVFEMALEVWGWEIQSLVFAEECADVTKEIMKIHRDIFFQKPLDLTKLIEEMADLKLMFDQIRYAFNEKEQDLFQRQYGLKLTRARMMLDEEVSPI